jgi:hypothetical protein
MRIASQNAGRWIDVKGFELADAHSHQIAWLGFGQDACSFVVPEVEAEIMRQTPAAQVLSITCKATPSFETKAKRTENSTSNALVSGLCVTFPLAVTIDLGADQWQLEVAHSFVAEELDIPSQTKRSVRFDVQSSAKMQ